ncbi:MAG: hypothetical protein KAI24_13275, partial [Planctomycetes bacterium]|nr:hypothetical protein [Planctomycetota bacterium]
MDAASLTLKKLREQVLENDGQVPLSLLLQLLVPLERLRALAGEFGVTPKGGFRIERAPAKVLAPKLAAERDHKRLEQLLRALVERPEAPADADGDDGRARRDAEAAAEARALLALRDQEVARLRADLERAREGQSRAREREADLERRLGQARDELTRAHRAAEEARSSAASPAAPRDDKALVHRLRELESEREGILAADEALRRQLARDRSRTRELEDTVAELESLIPASRRRKKKPLPPEPPAERRFLVPHLLPSFYK